jgi:hypothetical protein
MLAYVPIAMLSAHWGKVRPLIERANAKWGRRNEPEDLYWALRQNLAALYVAERGMVIAQKVIEIDGSTTCFVWLVVGELAEEREALQDELEALGRLIGAVRLRMASPSPAWGRASHGYWQVHQTIYEHQLGDAHDQVPAQSTALVA